MDIIHTKSNNSNPPKVKHNRKSTVNRKKNPLTLRGNVGPGNKKFDVSSFETLLQKDERMKERRTDLIRQVKG